MNPPFVHNVVFPKQFFGERRVEFLLFQIKRGEECGALESVKAASELYSPVSGIVVEKNKALEKAPAVINWSAEEDGWLFKIKLSDVKELENLMSKQNYEAYLKTQEEDGH
jgi:glycine cleavage system H protein